MTVDPTAVPSPWTAQPIGSGSTGGSATHTNGIFTLSTPGASLAATSDSFEFVSQPMTGDGTLIARIARLVNATGSSRSGIMVRETLDPSATNVFAGLTANSALVLQSRSAPGGTYSQITGPARLAPVWLKLTRASNVFTAFTSSDGVRWTQLGTAVTVAMAASVYAGFALCSDVTGPAATADFDHALAASGAAFYLSDAQPSTRNAVQNGASATYAVSVIPVNGFNNTVTLGASGLPSQAAAAFSSPTLAGAGGSLLTITTSGAAAGSYPITITGTSGAAVSRSVVNLAIVTSPVGTLPDPWTDQPVGGSGTGTATSFSAGAYTVTGPGLGFDGALDAFQFSSQALVGDAAFTARITAVQNAITSSRYGIMLRDGLAADAPFAALTLVRTAGGDRLDFLGRTTIGSTPVVESGATVSAPYWLRLVRAGTSFTAYASADGANWSQIGTARTTAMSTVISAGLAVASHDAATPAAATFDNITLAANNDFSLTGTTPARSVAAAAALYYHSMKAIALGSAMGAVTLSAANLPTGIAATFSAPTLSSGTVSNLRLDVAATVAPGTYTINITGVSGSLTHTVPLTYTVTASGTALPLPWAADDIGNTALPGSSTVASSGATVKASGQVLGGPLDSFRYTYQALTGDGTMITHMYTWDLRWDASRLGIMIRDSLLPDAAHALVRLRADVLLGQLLGDYPGFQYRAAPGAGTTEAEVSPMGALPYWFKLTRAGNLFTGSGSQDGLTWIPLGAPVTINMPPTVFIGYALSSGNTSALTTVSFDSSIVALAPDFYLQVTPASQTVPIGRGVAYSSVLLNSLAGFSASVTLSTPSLPPGITATFTPPTISNGASLLRIVSDSTVPGGTYPIAISGVSGALSHTTTLNFTVNPAQTTLPAPWLYDYIGPNPLGAQPSSTLVNGVFTLGGTACCLGGTSDTTFFAHQSLSGDGAIAGRLVSAAGAAGVMFRNTLDPASPFAAVTFAAGVMRVDTRSTAGGATIAAVSLPSSPSWLKVVRLGTQLTVYASLDGVQWYRIPTQVAISLSANTEVGLFASGGATFDNVSVSSSAQLLVSAYPPSIYSMNGVGVTCSSRSFREPEQSRQTRCMR